MTGRLQNGDVVDTPDGPGIVTLAYATFDRLTTGDWHWVRLDTGGEAHLYPTEQLEFIARQLATDTPEP